MSTEDVSVSLSRLALAKAIKTPDTNEEEAEPWSKSIIFHQSHIDAQMRNSIANPMSNKNKSRRPHNNNQPFFNKQHYNNNNRAPPMSRTRSDEHYTNRQYQQQRSNNNNIQIQRPIQSSPSAQNKSIKPGRRYIPSDDENEDDEDDEDDDDEDDDDDDDEEEKQPQSLPVKKPQNQKTVNFTTTKQTRIIEPSDDESDSDSEEEQIKKEKGKQPENDDTYARRMSTLRQLEQGTSVKSSKSADDAVLTPPAHAFVEPVVAGPSSDGSIEQWRMIVMEAEDSSLSTPGSVHSFIEEEEEEEEVHRPSTVSSLKQHKNAQTKRTTMQDMDMFYLQQQQQQQQHLYNMQLQQAMQMQQAQQMMQIQQYQQAAMKQYRGSMMMMENTNRQSSSNRVMPGSHKPHKKNSSKTSSRLLGNVPEYGVAHRSHHRQSQMMHGGGSPMPSISMSTPTHHYNGRAASQHMMMPPVMPPVMKPSRSSHHMSKRTSTFQYN